VRSYSRRARTAHPGAVFVSVPTTDVVKLAAFGRFRFAPDNPAHDMASQIGAFILLGLICTVISNLPAMLKRENRPGVTLTNRRMIAVLAAQSLLFAGYGLLVAAMSRRGTIQSLAGAALLGGVFAVIPTFLGRRPLRENLTRNVVLALSIAGCTIAAFVMSPMFGVS
jgi:hypothetical protein